MTKPESPLQLISTILDCLTVLIEDADPDLLRLMMLSLMRDLSVNIALDMQTEAREAA